MNPQKAYELIIGKLNGWMQALIKMLPNLILAVLILVLGMFLAGLLRKGFKKFFTRYFHHQVIMNLFSSFFYLLMVGIVVFTALTVLNLDKAVTSLLAGAGIVGLALAFAFQDIAANFVAGIVMSFTRPIKLGDWIKAGDHTGRVTEIRLRDTIIRSFMGQMVIIPNKEIFQNPIENFSMLGRRKMELQVGISYTDSLEQIKTMVLAEIEKLHNRYEDEPVKFYYEAFGDSSINFTVRVWIASPEPAVLLEARSEAIMRIKAIFDQAGIEIPFPIRTIDWAGPQTEKAES